MSVRRGHCDDNGGGGFMFTGLRVWVKVTSRENGDSPGIADGLVLSTVTLFSFFLFFFKSYAFV